MANAKIEARDILIIVDTPLRSGRSSEQSGRGGAVPTLALRSLKIRPGTGP